MVSCPVPVTSGPFFLSFYASFSICYEVGFQEWLYDTGLEPKIKASVIPTKQGAEEFRLLSSPSPPSRVSIFWGWLLIHLFFVARRTVSLNTPGRGPRGAFLVLARLQETRTASLIIENSPSPPSETVNAGCLPGFRSRDLQPFPENQQPPSRGQAPAGTQKYFKTIPEIPCKRKYKSFPEPGTPIIQYLINIS